MPIAKKVLKKVVRPVSREGNQGRVYLPQECIGKRVAILDEKDYEELIYELSVLKSLREVLNHLSGTNNGRKMFSVVTKTWNPVTGCYHNCVYCWARRLAQTKLRNSERYRGGFVPRLNESEFKKKFSGGIVFVSDMGDLFGDFVPSEWIRRVLDHVKRFPQTQFLFLTKNPSRYHEFVEEFPRNSILGATIETDDDILYRRENISGAPLPSLRYEAMKELKWPKKFISVEPILDFHLDTFVEWIKEIGPFMVYVGYDNYDNKLPEPPLVKTKKFVSKLAEFTFVVRKTIRPAWYETLEAIGVKR